MADSAAEAFWSDGYRRIDNLLTPQQCALIRHGMDLSRKEGRMRKANNRAYRGPHNQYAPLPGQMLLGSLAALLSEKVGRTLLPSFAFWRIYEKGDVLNPHKDRNACEVSVTIAIASEPGEQTWPIGVTDLHGRDHSIALTSGSGLLYQGTEVQHWRETLTGERQYQMFLHYVVEGGPFSALVNDDGLNRVPQPFVKS
jgi:alkylated DNA repair dioxygenase AlkB